MWVRKETTPTSARRAAFDSFTRRGGRLPGELVGRIDTDPSKPKSNARASGTEPGASRGSGRNRYCGVIRGSERINGFALGEGYGRVLTVSMGVPPAFQPE